MTQRKYKPTEAGLRMLRNLDAGRSPDFGLRGHSAYGGLLKTCAALRRAGLLTNESERERGDRHFTQQHWGLYVIISKACKRPITADQPWRRCTGTATALSRPVYRIRMPWPVPGAAAGAGAGNAVALAAAR